LFFSFFAKKNNSRTLSPALREGVINLLFEKAVAEPSFVTVYGELTERLLLAYHVPKDGDKSINMRLLLVEKCRHVFESTAEVPDLEPAAKEEFEMKVKRRVLGSEFHLQKNI
jgi:hypothetical protein